MLNQAATIQTVVAAVSVALLALPGRAEEKPATCATCHAREAEQLAASIHQALDCRECHQGEASYAVSAEALRGYLSGDAADGPVGEFDHGPSFAGKPTRAQIPDRCGGCHADVERMNPIGLRTDQLARYWTSGHGKALKADGDERVAVCVDCHGTHDVLPAHEPASRSHPLNVPQTCSTCHADAVLMAEYDLPVEVTEEYRQSVHGRLLLQQQDTGSPTCASCHGNHSAMPPGFATVGAVCGKCHQAAALNFASSVHAELEWHKGCVQCHGGGEGRHFHLIERITKPAGLLIQRYAHLLTTEPSPTAEEITQAIHPDPEQIIRRALPTCMDCHEDLEDDESLPKLFELLDAIADAERHYVQTGQRLDRVGQGMLLVDRQRFLFEDAKTHLIELAPLQHTLDNEKVEAKVAELNGVCAQINEELDALERDLALRYRALLPIWIFAVVFAALCYVKYKRLRAAYVKPLPGGQQGH